MNRRQFLGRLAALAVLPILPRGTKTTRTFRGRICKITFTDPAGKTHVIDNSWPTDIWNDPVGDIEAVKQMFLKSEGRL